MFHVLLRRTDILLLGRMVRYIDDVIQVFWSLTDFFCLSVRAVLKVSSYNCGFFYSVVLGFCFHCVEYLLLGTYMFRNDCYVLMMN